MMSCGGMPRILQIVRATPHSEALLMQQSRPGHTLVRARAQLTHVFRSLFLVVLATVACSLLDIHAPTLA
jgi:hypothetical protein